MTDVQVSMGEMQERVARFQELRPSKQAFVDTRIPEHVRDIYNVIGQGVTEDPDLKPAITAVEGFNVTYVGAESGKGAALHSHSTVEVFIALSGQWAVFWGDEGENEIVLDTVRLRLGAGRHHARLSQRRRRARLPDGDPRRHGCGQGRLGEIRTGARRGNRAQPRPRWQRGRSSGLTRFAPPQVRPVLLGALASRPRRATERRLSMRAGSPHSQDATA